MADKKISALPPASTPLAGTEVLPIVQGGITEQVSVANITAGRTVSMSAAAVGGALANWATLSPVQTGNGSYSGEASSAAMSHNVYFNGGWKYIASGMPASQYDQYLGTHRWFTAVSGTANGAISFNYVMDLDGSGNLTAKTGNVVIGTAGKGITNSTGSVALNFSTVGTALTGGAQSVLTGSFNNVGTAQTVTPDDTRGGSIVITAIQPGIGSTTYTLPFVKRGGTAAIGTPSKAILTADPLLSVVASGGDIVVTPIAGNTYITYAIYYTPLGA